jgi:branched-subunit amino acid ABC-type transport system permease component
MRNVDVTAFVLGVVLTGIAGLALWLAFAGQVDWGIVRIVAPLSLVVVGILGLALARNRG